MFIIGIYKFSTKPLALKRATFGNLVASPPSVALRKKLSGFRHCFGDFWNGRWIPFSVSLSTPEVILADDIEQCVGWLQAWAEQEEMEATEEELSLREYVLKVQQAPDASVSSVFLHETEAFAADLLVPYSRRVKILQFMRNIACKKDRSAIAVRMGLDEVYWRLYTRAKVALTWIGIEVRLLTFSLAAVAIALFARTPKPHDDSADVKVTYILFSSIALLELLSFLNIFTLRFGNRVAACLPCYCDPDLIYQQSLISSAARRRKPSWLLWLAALVSLDDLVMRHWYINQTPGMERIHEAVLAHITRGWDEYIHGDPALYREFNNLRGQRAVRNHQEVLSYIVNWPFDQSVLIWHVATEMCFQCRRAAEEDRPSHILLHDLPSFGAVRDADARDQTPPLLQLIGRHQDHAAVQRPRRRLQRPPQHRIGHSAHGAAWDLAAPGLHRAPHPQGMPARGSASPGAPAPEGGDMADGARRLGRDALLRRQPGPGLHARREPWRTLGAAQPCMASTVLHGNGDHGRPAAEGR
ncbi:hypothetical protein PAHAL_8G124700 [Panicum hallii]|uniref:DUF4220 domain-containing protein n=2 Tax=Panicum hallii TaxID=206008 RepID=A0A2T8I8S8_9POAL|nr:hypothetical protein PAHAL_8G124700 [Panicum hallii]